MTSNGSGEPLIPAPVLNDHSFWPVRASSAKASPITSPLKISPPPVARSDATFMPVVLYRHLRSPVSGSKALM